MAILGNRFNTTEYIMGSLFLKNSYISFNYEDGIFGINAPWTVVEPIEPKPEPKPVDPTEDSESSHTGVVVVIVILVILAVIGAGAYMFMRHRRRKLDQALSKNYEQYQNIE